MAMAPEQTGIGIRRHFTTDGIHPYDEVTWERRDARIVNFRDGSVAFEQRDVEFPVTWSQNATNIVAQKYFRGQLGSPEREQSLRQVIDRVADTITAWGIKDGYFVDAAESDAFRAELKHLIVSQKASFNSPVWFNIGVPGATQQASACQPYDALVSTPEGSIPIGRLVEDNAVGTKVFDAHGVTRIVAVKANGRKPVLRIHTKAGHILDVTADHLVWRASGQLSGRFVPAGKIEPGDKLEWHNTESGSVGSMLVEVGRIEALGQLDVYDIQTDSGEYLSSGGLRVHNCFILAVDDTMQSILNWYVEEGTIFKGGSGSGINLSTIRSSYESLKGGGTASGPVSFMRGADASAGTIKSGGTTRRAAKMVVLNADHPDIEDFIWCKAVEERKARALRDAGFDMDLDGKDSHSVQYQNANNSVRVTDEFMQAVIDDADWQLKAVTTGDTVRTMKARELFRQISEAAWECADPGLQFDTTINRWHTASNTGPITASNPCCFVGDTLVETADGPIPFELLHKSAYAGHELPAVHSFDVAGNAPVTKKIVDVWVAGRTDQLVEVRTRGGVVLRCTAEHRFLTATGVYTEAHRLVAGEEVRSISVDGSATIDRVSEVFAISLPEPVPVYDLEVEDVHNFAVTSGNERSAVVVHNSEYLHIDNSACNLASLNLLRFLNDDGTFDVDGFKAAVAVVFTAQEILVGNADYPTQKIAENSRRFRQLGLGYANLGAMLMALGLPYDSEEGRAWASGITALLTGHAYATSARTAARMGPFAGYMENQQPMNSVLRMHRDEVDRIDPSVVPADLLSSAREAWDTAVELSELYGVRNSQATVLAPTGCLVGGSLVPTDRGLVRLASLGDPDGTKWQDLGVRVATDEGPRDATRFYVNGLEPVVSVRTTKGYGIEGTAQHQLKVVDPVTGAWEWKRLADLKPGQMVPLAMNQLLGRPRRAALPALPPAGGRAGDAERNLVVPPYTTAALAELAGYFAGHGSVETKGITFDVPESDLDVVQRLEHLGKEAFGLMARVTARKKSTQVTFRSGRLARWWGNSGFARKGLIPEAILGSNDRAVYAAYLRGLFEAAGSVSSGSPRCTTSSVPFSREVQTLMLALGYPTVRTRTTARSGWRQVPVATVRLLNTSYASRWLDEVGFMSSRNNRAVITESQSYRHDEIPLPAALVERLATVDPWLASTARAGAGTAVITRMAAVQLFDRTADPELGSLLAFFYDRVTSAHLGDDELTYDISVPDNVTYLANGFVSHNTIGLMMDCDTTGIEPDLGLCKTKKLVGGGTMSIVNQTVPRALRRMGYTPEQIDDIIAYIDEHKSILGAPHLTAEHLPVFACSMGDNVIHYLGHVKMMAAVQPWISGAISKCVTADTLVPTADGLRRIGSLHQGEAPDSFRAEILEVASLSGTEKTDAFYYGGVRPVLEVVLESGHRVSATPNHRLLVSGDCGLEWRRLDELEPGDAVAVQYGTDLWSPLPAFLEGVLPVEAAEMTVELAFLLGALVASGGPALSGSTVTVAGAPAPVLGRLAAAWKSEVGASATVVDVQGEPRAVVVTSPRAAELVRKLGWASGAASWRIPEVVLESTREVVLAFLEGLALAADVTVAGRPAWCLSVEAPRVLDDVQAVLTNLGIVHWRAAPDQLYVTGRHAQCLVELVPLAAPDKAARAERLASMDVTDDPAEVLDPLSGDDQAMLRDTVRFSPVASVADGGHREVFDISVPSTHAFVGNGIVNHNTINMPEEVGVEEVEQLHIDAWRMGLKAVAIYRDNCKVGQPLSTTKKAAVPVPADVAPPLTASVMVREPVRDKLPRKRNSKTFSFRVADCHGYVTVGEYADGRPGEIFLRVAKQGSTLAGIMDAFAISVSHGLQYGVPLKAFVEMYTNMRFEPAGMTDDPDIRFASSLVDYIFRRMAVEYLTYDDRAELGILTVEERMQPTLPGVEEETTPSSTGADVMPQPARETAVVPAAESAAALVPPEAAPMVQPVASDAPYCYQCGMVMQRAGACFVCSTCGTTSGCS